MRKLRILFVALAGLLSASGLQVRAHWCDEELTSVDFFAHGHHDCGCEHGDQDLGGCCREVSSRVESGQCQSIRQERVASIVIKAEALPKHRHHRHTFADAGLLALLSSQPIRAGSMDEPEGVPLYLWHGVFRT